MNISLVQTSSEIKLIEKNFEGEIIYLPVEMSALCYLKLNKLKYIDPIRYLKNDFHYESLKIVEKYILNLKNMDQKTYGENEEFKARIRFSLNASVFVISLLEEVLKKTKINKIIVSGWHGNNVSSFYSPSTFWISKIVFCLRHKFHIELVNKEKFSEKSYKKNFIYEIKKTKIKKNSILINNLGYNFKRIIISNIFRQHSIYFINFENLKINIVKKIFLKLFGLNIIEVKRIVTNTKLSLTEKLSFQYKDYDLSEFINSESLRAQYNLHNIKKKKESFSEFMFDNTFEYYLTCSMRGFDGAIVENLKRQNCKTLT